MLKFRILCQEHMILKEVARKGPRRPVLLIQLFFELTRYDGQASRTRKEERNDRDDSPANLSVTIRTEVRMID